MTITTMPAAESLADLSDEQLDQRIERFSRQMIEAHARYQASSAIEDRVVRDQAHLALKEAQRERARRADLA